MTLKTNESLTIREAEKSDAASLVELVNQIAGETNFLTFGKDEFNKTVSEEEDFIEKQKISGNGLLLVAELKNEIVGMLNVNTSSKPRLRHIADFGTLVRKDFWGIGIGNCLLRSLLDWAKNSNVIKKINLKVQTDNKTAISLYKKFGFEIEGVIRRDSFVDNKYYDTYAMGILIN